MRKIKLNEKQILELIKNRIISVEENETIEIYNDSIILNNCGAISYINSLELDFIKSETCNKFIQNLICEHFNIEKNNVITISSNLEASEFIIRFSPKDEIYIIVLPITTLIKKLKLNRKSKIDENTTQIGLYRRLGNSAYFFRINHI